VIGLGAMGASACFHLATRGLRVLGLEQFDIPHNRGSSHGYSRMIRLAYYEMPEYVPLLRRAYQLWNELEEQSQQKLLYRTGGVYMGPPNGKLLTGAHTSAAEHALNIEALSGLELRHRWPQFHIPDVWQAIVDPEAGFLRPERVITSYAILAMRAGADLHAHEAVRGWSATNNGVTVITEGAQYHAQHAVFAGGAWSAKLITDLGINLKVTRQALGWVWPRKPHIFDLNHLPVWAIDAEARGGIYYGFPMISDVPGFKLAHHHRTDPAVDPDTVVRDPQSADEEDFRPVLREYIPEANGSLLAIRICLYTNTDDDHFILDYHPVSDRVQIACGFSGHGFKFASVIGEILADRITGQASSHPSDFLRLNRFTRTNTM